MVEDNKTALWPASWWPGLSRYAGEEKLLSQRPQATNYMNLRKVLISSAVRALKSMASGFLMWME